jgi:hypothetical protein
MSESPVLLKYPRTPHLAGSNLQPGDFDLSQVDLAELAGRELIVEEKLDGANCAISFDADRRVWLQSRGHWLVGGPRERHFEQLKSWASVHSGALWEVLGTRYVMYGEWLGAKHTVFYDALPHLFMEFDVYDREQGVFLDTSSRRALLGGVPVVSVPVVYRGAVTGTKQLKGLIGPSLYKTEHWRAVLAQTAESAGQDPEMVAAQSDDSDLAEGLYIKDEEDGSVVGRYKWVRASFCNAIIDGNGATSGHWLDRPHLGNRLAEGVDLYSDVLSAESTRLRPGQVL